MNKHTAITICILILVILFSGCIETVTDGRHYGQITAIEKEGLIWKTYTVYVKTDISSSQEDTYCLEDVSLLDKISQYSRDRQKVTISFKDELIVAPWRCGRYNGGIMIGVIP